jgi:cytochrome b561
MRAVSRYHPALVAIHWILAVLIIADLAIGTGILAHLPNDSPRKLAGLRAHMSAGMLILFLMTLRLGVRSVTARPADAPTGSAVLDRVAWLSHRALYVAVIGLPLSGLALALQAHLPQIVFLGQGRLPTSLWIYPLRYVHLIVARTLIALIALHIAGAAYHVFLRRDGLLRRMWFGRRDLEPAAAPRRDGMAAVWFGRAVLLAATLLFTTIGVKFVADPLHAAAASGITLTHPLGFTNTRTADGGFPLALAAVLAFCLGTGRLRTGLGMVAATAGVILVVRVAGAAVDGTLAQSVKLMAPETVLLVAALAGAWAQSRAARDPSAPQSRPTSAPAASAPLG